MADERVTPGITDIGNLQKHIARYNLAMRFCENKNVLDIACGTGYGTEMLSWVAKSAVGVDISEEAIWKANSQYLMKYRADGNEFVCSDLQTYKHKPFDTIVCFETIEHIEDLDKAQENLANLLKPGGQIVYSVPLYENYHNEYHKHKFTVETGEALFPTFEHASSVIQMGLNFLTIDPRKPFTYLIVSKVKPL